MKKNYYILFLLLFTQAFHTAFAQGTPPAIAWQKTIGGSGSDVLTAMAICADKSVVLCGYSNSGKSGDKTDTAAGGYDYWVVKLDSSGTILWNKTYGGSKNDFASAIITTTDGGYLVGGSSISNQSGSKSSNSYSNSFDYWVLKLDANGNKVWDKTLGGVSTDKLTSLTALPAGGYAVGGYAYSANTGTKTSINLGTESNADYWTIILNNDGTERSQTTFGGGGHDVLAAVSPYGLNGYYAAGYSYSLQRSGAKSQNVFGNNDYYIIRYNLATKKTEFQGDFGSKLSDYLTCMQVLPDSSVIVGGYSNSPASNSKKEGFFGVMDIWLLKLKKNGTKQWDKTFAGSAGDGFGGDYMVSVQQTKDKGFILGGYSNSNAGRNKTENAKGGCDYWIIKTDSSGNIKWNKTIGGSSNDKLTAVYELDSGRYIVAGTSLSPVSGDKTSGNIGAANTTDYWILRLGASGTVKTNGTKKISSAPAVSDKYLLEVMPNPVKDALTIKCSGAAIAGSKANFVIYTTDGKIVLQSTLTIARAQSTHSFNVAHLPAGDYFAVLYVDGLKLTKTFTKE